MTQTGIIEFQMNKTLYRSTANKGSETAFYLNDVLYYTFHDVLCRYGVCEGKVFVTKLEVSSYPLNMRLYAGWLGLYVIRSDLPTRNRHGA